MLVIRPGGEARLVSLLPRAGNIAAGGRIDASYGEEILRLPAVIMRASRMEIRQWESTSQFMQEGHPVTHKVILRGRHTAARPGDLLVCVEDGRRFEIKGAHNPAELGAFTVLFAEERLDLP